MRVFCVSAVLAFGCLSLASEPPTISVDMATKSRYIWKGLSASETAVFQPSVSVDYRGFTFGVWANSEIGKTSGVSQATTGSGEFNEVDVSLAYTMEFGKASSTFTIARYEFPNTGFSGYTEALASVTLDAPFQPTLEASYDFASNGAYLKGSLSHRLHAFEFSDFEASVELGSWIAWGSKKHNEYWYGTNRGGLADWGVELVSPISMGEWTLTPSVAYTNRFSSAVGAETGKRSHFVFGATLSIQF
ncbi:MAG: hypothetical protein KIT74_02480 [Fimbriimonadales bacterium]|nr:hypothetical protein [Fimbriimonadales bacterium]